MTVSDFYSFKKGITFEKHRVYCLLQSDCCNC